MASVWDEGGLLSDLFYLKIKTLFTNNIQYFLALRIGLIESGNHLIEGIKGLKSVAVEALPGNPVRVYGPYRLVKYVLFLIREVFPIHDELCYEEGRLMLEHIAGNESAAKILAEYRGRVAKRMDRFWS